MSWVIQMEYLKLMRKLPQKTNGINRDRVLEGLYAVQEVGSVLINFILKWFKNPCDL